uniref:S-adenosyl-L-methionine:salicylic acid methyltransferase n=1 Tax=Antirrhinum majus TaxID=4151 RepID=Q8H6N2_ANTMA|nr:S-adenosyl-L-methionine:salicylic acid methyltransferase [Antirrhinum majus]
MTKQTQKQNKRMKLAQVLHMNGGLGKSSYASNSLVQRKVISITKPIIEEAMTEFYTRMLPSPHTISIADLGCSCGPNTLLVAAELVKIIVKLRQKLDREPPPEFQIHLNDLPGNDFNSIFRYLLPMFREELREEIGGGEEAGRRCFVSGVPGSFYGRLFPTKSLHFVHSSYSLMWLSKVPEGVKMNKENIYIASTSPQNVINAYYEQFQRDFSSFLICRSEEVIGGGRMVLTFLGRKSASARSKECCYIWELLSLALKQLVLEGVIEKEKLHSFHIPQYTPSPTEVKAEVEKEGSFTVNRLEVSEITWASCGNDFHLPELVASGNEYNVAKCMRSVAEPLLIEHFGESVIDRLFEKYREIIFDRMSREETKFFNVTISMTRRE